MSRRLVAGGHLNKSLGGPRIVAAGRITGRRCGFEIDPETLARHEITSQEEAHRLGKCALLHAEEKERRKARAALDAYADQTPEVTA